MKVSTSTRMINYNLIPVPRRPLPPSRPQRSLRRMSKVLHTDPNLRGADCVLANPPFNPASRRISFAWFR